tara:strand:+ start:2909 stop:3862 length:954 start_codon:yes stop_codon:yes gene_type:complete
MVLFSIAHVFAVTMDSSINVVGMDVEYSVTKALEYTTALVIKTELNKITISHADDASGVYHNIAVSITGTVDVASNFNDTLQSTVTTGWSDISDIGHVTEACQLNLTGNTSWTGSVSDALDHMVNAALDKHLNNVLNSLATANTAVYANFTAEEYNHAKYAAVNHAWIQSEDTMFSGAASFGELLNSDLNNNSGNIDVTDTSSQSIVTDVYKQYAGEHVNDLDDLDTSHGLGDMLSGNKIEFVLQIIGSGADGKYEFVNNSTNVLLADPSESGAVPTSGTGADVDINGTDCITKGAPENTIGLLCQPAVLLLRYTVA